ncbi:hypothetical protein MKW92_044149 [Papaver armeniacum]|nr:hypothetical protein MKW92_044149 [Papaver armeniacum]
MINGNLGFVKDIRDGGDPCLVQSPNSSFMCQGLVVCGNCQTVLCQPTGGKARLTEGCSFRRKGD